jgi:hypothetical protein
MFCILPTGYRSLPQYSHFQPGVDGQWIIRFHPDEPVKTSDARTRGLLRARPLPVCQQSGRTKSGGAHSLLQLRFVVMLGFENLIRNVSNYCTFFSYVDYQL